MKDGESGSLGCERIHTEDRRKHSSNSDNHRFHANEKNKIDWTNGAEDCGIHGPRR